MFELFIQQNEIYRYTDVVIKTKHHKQIRITNDAFFHVLFIASIAPTLRECESRIYLYRSIFIS